MKFSSYNLKKELVNALVELGYINATPIQEAVIPKALKKKSLICKSETGSGKTHSFLIPSINNLNLLGGTFDINNNVGAAAREYLLTHFLPETKGVDVMIGYRADDSYFSFASDFLHNIISLQKLEDAMRLGDLGNQIVLISPKAFKQIKFN